MMFEITMTLARRPDTSGCSFTSTSEKLQAPVRQTRTRSCPMGIGRPMNHRRRRSYETVSVVAFNGKANG